MFWGMGASALLSAVFMTWAAGTHVQFVFVGIGGCAALSIAGVLEFRTRPAPDHFLARITIRASAEPYVLNKRVEVNCPPLVAREAVRAAESALVEMRAEVESRVNEMVMTHKDDVP